MSGQAQEEGGWPHAGPVRRPQAAVARWCGPGSARPTRRQHREVHPLQAQAESAPATSRRLRVAPHQPDGTVPGGLTTVRLLLVGICLGTWAIGYSMARPSGESAGEVGSRPVPVVEGPSPETPRLGRAAKLPPLAPRRRAPVPAPAPAPAPVAPVEPPRRKRPRRAAPPADSYVLSPARASSPAAPPAPVYEPPPPVYESPPPPQPRPQAPEPDVVTFDDSG
jgi:hypothetical protein